MPNSILKITWATGNMTLDMACFFPCSQVKLKKLLKIIRDDWNHEDDLLNQMIEYQKFQIQNIKTEIEADETNLNAKTSLKRWEGLLNTTEKFRR